MKFKRVLLVTSLVIFSILPIAVVNGATVIEDNDVVVIISIQNAYYYAAHEDGIENDIAVDFTLDIHRTTQRKNLVHFDLWVQLTLPSGLSYLYLFKVTSSAHVYAQPTAYFDNHATESGWYCVELTGVLAKGNCITCIGTESYLFDPPGGTEGTDPLTCMISV